jgi:hypothetical protein
MYNECTYTALGTVVAVGPLDVVGFVEVDLMVVRAVLDAGTEVAGLPVPLVAYSTKLEIENCHRDKSLCLPATQ